MTEPIQHHPTPTSHRGATLVELLVVIVLLGAFMPLSGRLFLSTMRWSTRTFDDQTKQQRLDHAVDTLRNDVWGAYEITLGDRWTLLLRRGADRTIVWRIALAEGEIQRRVSEAARLVDQQTWPLDDNEMTFQHAGSALVVELSGGSMPTPLQHRLYSQLHLLGTQPLSP